MTDLIWYFAYGSNLCRDTFERRREMQPRARQVACLTGWRLRFDLPVGPGERAVANVVPDPGACVYGVAYALTGPDATRLDRTEGVGRGYYARASVRVELLDGGPLGAFTYQSARGVAGRKPSARYVGLLLTGAREHGLPAAWLDYLAGLDLAVDERIAPG